MYVHSTADFLDPHPSKMPVLRVRAPKLRKRIVKPFSHVFHEGDDADNIYEVLSGVLRLTRVLENGRRQVISFGYPGDYVGFPKDGLHHTDCDAVTAVEVAVYRTFALENASADPGLHQRIIQAALHEISDMQDHFMTLGCKTATEKLASFLLALAQRVGRKVGAHVQFELPMLRSDIADFLGLTPETISRTFTFLRSERIIAIDKVNTVILVDAKALLALAETE